MRIDVRGSTPHCINQIRIYENDRGEGKIIEAPYETVSGKRVGPNEREITYGKRGKAVLIAHSRVSADGKTITVNVKGTDTQGKPVDAVAVYDKQ